MKWNNNENCRACELENKWNELSNDDRARAIWEETAELCLDCGDYFLVGVMENDAAYHPVERFFAWENEKESIIFYKKLCTMLRKEWGENFENPKFVPYKKPSKNAVNVFQEASELGLELEKIGICQPFGINFEKHVCSEFSKI